MIRRLFGDIFSLAVLTVVTQAQPASVLSLNSPGVDQLDIIVLDVAAWASSYMLVLNTTLHAQPLGESVRHFSI